MCLAVPGQIVSVTEGDPLERTGRVRFGGVIQEVRLGFVPEAQVGDYVIVHVGVAISKLDEDEARQVWSHLARMGELDELESAHELR